MLKIIKTLKTAILVCAIFVVPTFVSAGESGYYGEDYYSPSDYSGWTYSEGDYDYSYNTPYTYDSYDYTPYTYDSYDYGYDNNDYGNYGSYDYGYNYPSYSTPASYGNIYGGYQYPTVGGSRTTTPVVTTSGSNANSNAVASAVANNNNVNNNVNNNTNVNNVYVYTNPSGTAVVNNPGHQRLDGVCVISPNNPRVGQSVTATASATGGIGSYTYQWSGDLSSGWGASTSFTSYNPGTKNLNVTIRSGEEVITRSCSVTFVQETAVQDFSAACYPSVQNTTVGQTVTWRVTVSGSGTSYGSYPYYSYGSYGYNNNYTYSWTGSDGLYGNGSAVSKTYTYPGTKSATVTISNGYRTISTTCSANVNQVSAYQPTSGTPVSGVYVQPDQIKITSGTPVSGVYLNDLPATGVDLSWKQYMIGLMVLILASAAFLMSRSRKNLYATQE